MTKTDKKIDELIDSPQTNQTVQQGRCDELATDSSSADDSGEVKTGDANSDMVEKAYCKVCKFYVHWRNWQNHLDYHRKKGLDEDEVNNLHKFAKEQKETEEIQRRF